LLERGAAALFLDPGLGKTSITLEALRIKLEHSQVRKTLVVAPLRVCQLVWRQEGEKWSQFRDLRFSLVHGTQKKRIEALETEADIYLINPEGVEWLVNHIGFKAWPFDGLVIDELTKFKNHQSKRSKALRKKARESKFVWGLTGTPTPNGYMDLFGQMLLLDDGAALGNRITAFRDRYFKADDFLGYDYKLRPGAAERIEERIKPYALRMSAEEYLELPELVHDVRRVRMDTKSRKLYDTMKKDALAELDDGIVTGANAAAVYSKLKQMANGAVYLEGEDGKRKVTHIHDAKLEAIEELIEELQGQQVLIAYEFQHDLERLRDRLRSRFGDIPFLGRGVNGRAAEEIEAAWNAGEIPILLAHPASAGHGLNFQKSGAQHICWFSLTIDLELYDQFIGRVHRQGNTADHVVNHVIVVDDTVDALTPDVLEGKSVTQDRLLAALSAELGTETGEEKMAIRRIKRKSDDAPGAQEAPQEAPQGGGAPAGWGKPASAEDTAPESDEAAPEAIDEDQMETKLRGGFYGDVAERLERGEVEAVEEAPAEASAPAERQITTSPEDRKPVANKAKATPGKSSAKPKAVSPSASAPSSVDDVRTEAARIAASINPRDVRELLDAAREIEDYLRGS
jgi:hypothetical protein